MANLVFITWDSKELAKRIQAAQEQDGFEEVRKINRQVDAGNRVWSSWAIDKGGSVGDFFGFKGTVQVPAHSLAELPKIREQFGETLGAWVSVGVGTKLSDAIKALEVSRLQNRPVVFYTQECEQIIEDANKPKDDLIQQIQADTAKNGLKKEETAVPEGLEGPATPITHQKETSQGQAIRKLVDEQDAPPEKTHAAQDMEEEFHSHAKAGDEEDAAVSEKSGKNINQIKTTLAQALMVLKQNAPAMEQIKAASPELYQSMLTLSQATVALARELKPETGTSEVEPAQKAELLPEGTPPSQESEGDIEAMENKDEGLGKVAVPSTKPHLNLPVGSLVDGKVKNQHSDGSVSWASIRSGAIRSQTDSSGHPTSALRPKAK